MNIFEVAPNFHFIVIRVFYVRLNFYLFYVVYVIRGNWFELSFVYYNKTFEIAVE